MAAVAVAAMSAPAQAAVPTGFTVTQYATGFTRPYAMQFAPDGRLFVSQQGGKMRVVKNGTLLAAPFMTLTVDSSGDRGLIGFAFDPEFTSNNYIYVYYTATTPTIHNRVSRFTANGDVVLPGSELVLLDIDDLGSATIHNGGAVHFGPDGKLYITTGENATPSNAQSMSTLLGKVIRINRDGTIPTDNPFYATATGKYKAIWALGLRNPFTAAFQPGPSRFFINDVGARAWEEIDAGVPGANYGWPETEGFTSDPRFHSPVFAYSHGPPLISETNGCAIAGGTFYNPPNPQFPAEYTSAYFFADNCSGWIRRLDTTGGNAVTGFATGIEGPIDLKVGPDGALYYLSRPYESGSGSVFRVAYSGLPAISRQPLDQTVSPGQPATFSVTASGLEPLGYQWQRDGVDLPGATSSSYTLPLAALSDTGAQFRCIVTNALGSTTSSSATLTVTSNGAPAGSITTPGEATTFDAGDTITYSGTGTDPEDGEIPAAGFTWSVVFHHNTHTHSFIPPSSGAKNGSFTIPDAGETASDVYYRIHLTVTDSSGRTHSSHRDVTPNTSTLNIATSPGGLQVKLDDQPTPTPLSQTSVVGMRRTLGVVSPQVVGGVTYEFDSWSDGGAATHEITTPVTGATYTAVYRAVADTTKPTVSVTAPVAGATVSGTVDLAAQASDSGGVTSVKWLVDGVEVGYDSNGAPWTKSWNSATVANGSHKVYAKARDTAGNWGTSATLTFTVNNGAPDTTPPTVSVSAPAAGATVSGSFALAAAASDDLGVTSVAWFVDGLQVAADADGAPWTKTWDSATVSNGSHTVYATASDAAGNRGSSATSTFTVSNGAPDTVKPTVSVTVPVAGATVSGTVDLAAQASDSGGVTSVKWFVDGVEVGYDSNGAPWTKSWNSATVANGSHKVYAKARDTAGNWGTSVTLTFTVSNGVPDTTAPTVAVSAPAAGTTVSGSVALAAEASDNVGVTSVKWYVDGLQVAEDADGAPWTKTWDSSTVSNGSHTVHATASDAAGNAATSQSLTFLVSNQPVDAGLFGDGFESGTLSAWTTVLTGADGTANVQSATVKTGTYAAQLSATAATGSFAYARKTLASPQTELTVSGDFQILQEGASGGDVPIFRLLDATGARILTVARQNADLSKVRVKYGGAAFTSTGRMVLNAWAHFEARVVVAGTGVSTVEVWLDGALIHRTTTASLGYEGVATIQIGNDTARQTFTLVADNITARA